MNLRSSSKILAALALTASVASSWSSSASADEPAGSATQAVNEAVVVNTVFSDTVSDVSPSAVRLSGKSSLSAAAAAASSCKTLTTTAIGENITGVDLYKFKQTSTWCYNGNKITSRYSDFTVSTHYPGWGWKGLVTESVNSTGAPFVAYRQGHFALCLPTPWGDVCSSNGYPWVRHTMRINGTYTSEYGNGI